MKKIQLRPKIADHDFQTKLRAVRRLVLKHKVKIQIFFRGREITHPDIGMKLLDRMVEGTSDIARVEARCEKDNRYFLILVSL